MAEPAFYKCSACGRCWQRMQFKMRSNPPAECPGCGAGPDKQGLDQVREDEYMGRVYRPLVNTLLGTPEKKETTVLNVPPAEDRFGPRPVLLDAHERALLAFALGAYQGQLWMLEKRPPSDLELATVQGILKKFAEAR